MLTSLFRVIKFAFQDFFRNFWLSVVTLTILVLALFTINLLIIFNLIANSAISSVEQRIDINVYFLPEIKEEQVINVSNYLESLMEVKEVDYISRDQALLNFKERHKDEPKIIESLEQLDDNPLGSSLVIKAKSRDSYEKILTNLEDEQYENMIERKEIDDHRAVITKITNIIDKVNMAVIIVAIIFTIIAISIIFNAIRIAIYTHRDEIIAMKLIGATDWFVITPYLLQGVIFALLSVIITIIIIFPMIGFVQPHISTFLDTQFDLVAYFQNNLLFLFGLQFLAAVVINLISSYWAVHRYVRV